MVSDIQKKGQGIAVERLEPREKIKTSHLLTLLPEKSCKETFLDAVTSRILVVWFSTSISLVPFLLPSFLHYVSMSQVKRNTHKHTIWCRHTSSRSWRYKYNITTTIHDRTSSHSVPPKQPRPANLRETAHQPTAKRSRQRDCYVGIRLALPPQTEGRKKGTPWWQQRRVASQDRLWRGNSTHDW